MRQQFKEEHGQYRMGRRLDMLKWSAALIILVISFCFYFIYQFLLEPIAPQLKGMPLMLAFLAVDVCLIVLEFKLLGLYRSRTYYRVCNDALEYVNGRRTVRYDWNDFTAAEYGRIRPGCICPVTFTVQGKELLLNQYTENVYGLAAEILRHIEKHAQVDERLLHQVEVMAEF